MGLLLIIAKTSKNCNNKKMAFNLKCIKKSIFWEIFSVSSVNKQNVANDVLKRVLTISKKAKDDKGLLANDCFNINSNNLLFMF